MINILIFSMYLNKKILIFNYAIICFILFQIRELCKIFLQLLEKIILLIRIIFQALKFEYISKKNINMNYCIQIYSNNIIYNYYYTN